MRSKMLALALARALLAAAGRGLWGQPQGAAPGQPQGAAPGQPQGAAPTLALALALLAASGPGVALADSHLEREAWEIARLLRCPICQNLSVADSPSQLAQQMRDLIRKQLEAGQTREAILTYFVERSGEEVLLDPPRTGFSQVIWWGAAAIPLGGAALVALLLRRWLRRRAPDPGPELGLSQEELQEYEAVLERELERSEERSVW
ncbi:MAG: cytochrome c-type biogenesis protein CcmH [Chloroflexi bacterium]|nr:cytochrome c-type biogenesis protein CcmH [Chloroflexota bacterium]